MSHHVYHTESIVLSGRNSGEANRDVSLLTRELGLVYASVKSAREVRSKLRYGLQDYSYGTASLIRGRGEWKVVGIATRGNYYYDLVQTPDKRELVGRLFALLRRLLAGEEPHPELFDLVESGLGSLMRAEGTTDELVNLEQVLVLRMLHRLGYIQHSSDYEALLSTTLFDMETLAHMARIRATALREINRALSASHL